MQVLNRYVAGKIHLRSPATAVTASKSWALQLQRRSFPTKQAQEAQARTIGTSGAVHRSEEATTSSAGHSLASSTLDQLPSCSGIDLIFGPMFAGKSSELLRRIVAHEAAGRRVMVIKSDKDDRYGTAQVVTHDGSSKACYAVKQLKQVKESLEETYELAEVIAIDEAQFFPDLLQFCRHAADEDNKRVIVAGLDGDFQRQKFGQILDLVPNADSVTKLAARCTYCEAAGRRQDALFSLRIAADKRQEVVGGADKYAPVCRKHYNALTGVRNI